MLLGGLPAAAASGVSIGLQPQSPTYPEYSVATYTVEAYGDNLKCTWYLDFQGETYNISDTSGSAKPWEWYAGETYGASKDGNKFQYFFGGIGAELDGAEIYCKIKSGNKTVTSDKAIISIGGDAMPPETRVAPSMTVMQGDMLDLYCYAVSPDGSSLNYTWYETSTGKLYDIIAVNRGSETNDTLRCDTSEIGTRYYVCMVTTSVGGSAYTSVIPVTVTEPEIIDPPEITTENLPEAEVGEEYSVKIKCTDENAEFNIYYNPGKNNDFEKTGLMLSSSGKISGTPEKAGTYEFCVCASGEGGEDYMTYKLTVKEHVHEYSEWMITTEPTCTESGQKLRECNCGNEDREDIPAAGHSWDEDGDVLICTVCGKTISQLITATDTVSESDASESDENAGALLSDNTPSQKEENKGMPWWGILLIALGAAAVGVGVTYVIFLKNNGGSGNYYTRDDSRRRNYGREPYDRGNYGRGQDGYDDGQYGCDEYEDGSYDDGGYDNSPRSSYGNDSYGRNGYRPDSNGRRNNNRR